MNKKSLFFIIILVALVSIFAVSCSKEKAKTYSDGEYFAIEDEFPASGWKEYVALSVKGGKIVKVDWGGVNRNGDDKKAYDKAGNYNMVKFGGAIGEWWEQAEKVEQHLIKTQDPAKIKYSNNDGNTDEISGVTISVNEFFTLADKALKAGPVKPGTYKDGGYYAIEAEFPSSGWKAYVSLLVKNGNIVEVYWSGLNDKGEDKKDYDKAGNYNMAKFGGAIADWWVQAERVEQHLLKSQDPAKIKYSNNDGNTDEISGVTITVDDFFNLANQALKQGPKSN